MAATARPKQYNVLRMRDFDRSCIRPDLFAGLGVAAYLIPQVMAYATLAGLDPVVGLWACLAPLTLYAVVGTSRLRAGILTLIGEGNVYPTLPTAVAAHEAEHGAGQAADRGAERGTDLGTDPGDPDGAT